MTRKPNHSLAVTPLRRRAETRLRARAGKNHSAAGAARSTADTQRLLHELQVHQIELEMQNEELKKARDEMEAGLDKYSELYDFAPVGYLTLGREGDIREANLTAASLLGVHRASAVKQRFIGFVAPTDRAPFAAFFEQVLAGARQRECDVTLHVRDKPPVEVRLRANRYDLGAGCRLAMSDITQHKLAEAAVRESEERFHAMANAMSQLAWIARPDGHIFWYNERWHAYTGTTLAQMQGWGWQGVHDPAELPGVLKRWKASLASGSAFEMTFPLRGADGTFRHFLTRAIPLKNAADQVVQWFGTNTDVQELKRAGEKMRVSEVRYRRLFEAAQDGVLILDPATGKITDANPFMTKLIDYGRDQLVGKELFEIGLLKDEAASREMFQRLKRNHEVRYEDLPLKSKDGRHQEVEVVANLYRESGHDVIQCNIRDITERKRTELALHKSETQYRSLFVSIDEGFCVIEMLYDRKGRPADFRYVEVNPAFARQTGISDGVGKRILEIAPQHEGYWIETYGKVVRTGNPVRFTEEAKALNRWFDCYAFRIGGKESRKVAVIFSNITERKRTEDALNAARKELSAHAAQLERMVAVRTAQLTATNRRLEASVESITQGREQYRSLLVESEFMQQKLRHLTRQFLTAQEDERRLISRELHDGVVQTLVGIGVELSALGKATSIGLGAVKTKLAHTQRLVEKSISAVHEFARELRPAVLDDLGLIPALHALMKGVTERKKLKIHLTAAAGAEALDNTRRTVLFRVAQEALANVVRHSGATEVNVRISEIPGAVRMEVHDNGKSFRVLQVLSPRTNKRLGLLGMRERVEMVGGMLRIDSAPGKGTTVRAEVPAPPPPPTQHPHRLAEEVKHDLA